MTHEINDMTGLFRAVGKLEGLVETLVVDMTHVKTFINTERVGAAAEAAENQRRDDEIRALQTRIESVKAAEETARLEEQSEKTTEEIRRESRRKRAAAWVLGIMGPLGGIITRWLTWPHHPHQAPG